MANQFYDGTKLLSMPDLYGQKPELYLCTTNRSGGKTTWFSRLLVNKYKKDKSKFALLYRFNYELDDIADKFFKDINRLFFPKDEMTAKRKANGIYQELFLNGESCGYGISINSADQLKKNSHLFSDVDRILFDEFQSETSHYCANEVQKFRNIHVSIARGQNKQSRYVPVYMLSNPVTLLNPYYAALKVGSRIQSNTKFLRGDGWVLENGFVASAAKAQTESAFNRAFAGDNYDAYNTQGVYLNDNLAFIGKPHGRSFYVCTLLYNDGLYAIKEYPEEGLMYVDSKPDLSCPRKLTVTTADHRLNYVLLKRNDVFIQNMRFLFEKGCFRFSGLAEKDALISALSFYN